MFSLTLFFCFVLFCFLQVTFTFDANEIKVKLADEHELCFPNRLGLDNIEYIAVDGDFKIKVLKFA